MKTLLMMLTITSDVLVITVVVIGAWLVAVGEPLLQSSRASFFPELCLVALVVVGVTVLLGIIMSHRFGRKV